jgi:hypothetical protein
LFHYVPYVILLASTPPSNPSIESNGEPIPEETEEPKTIAVEVAA